MTSHLLKTLREVLMDAVHVSFDFFKVLIPISIAMKILAELDWIRYLALPLEPVMQLTGLPADLGIAWATGIMVNFYSALIVFIGLLPGLPPLTTEQVTTLAVMMLIAHSLIDGAGVLLLVVAGDHDPENWFRHSYRSLSFYRIIWRRASGSSSLKLER